MTNNAVQGNNNGTAHTEQMASNLFEIKNYKNVKCEDVKIIL